MVKIDRKILIIICISSITLIQDILGLNILMFAKAGIYLVVLLKCKKNNLLKYFIIFSCFSTNILLYILNILFGFIYIYRNYKTIVINGKTKCFIFLGFWELLHAVLIAKYNLSINLVINQLATTFVFIICGLYINDKSIKEEANDLIRIYIIATIFMGLVLLIKRLNYYGFGQIFLMKKGIGTIKTDGIFNLMMNANTVSKKMGIVLSLLIAQCGINRKITITKIIQILLVTIIGLFTFSLSFVIYTAICILLIVGYELFIRRKTKKSIMIGIILLLGIGFSMFYLSQTDLGKELYNVYRKSFMEEDISNGRIDIYMNYMHLIGNDLSTLFWGQGLSTYSVLSANKLEMQTEILVHNTILEVILSWGVVGLVTTIVLFKMLISENKQKNFYMYIPAICLLLYMMTGNFFIGYYSNLILIFIIYTNFYFKREEVKNETRNIKEIA